MKKPSNPQNPKRKKKTLIQITDKHCIYYSGIKTQCLFWKKKVNACNEDLTLEVKQNNKNQYRFCLIASSSGFKSDDSLRDLKVSEILNSSVYPTFSFETNFSSKKELLCFINSRSGSFKGTLLMMNQKHCLAFDCQFDNSQSDYFLKGEIQVSFDSIGIKRPRFLAGIASMAAKKINIGFHFKVNQIKNFNFDDFFVS